ncbi:MAG: hypothetical protein ACK5LK_09675 [Chthoniobacterales bacterium]
MHTRKIREAFSEIDFSRTPRTVKNSHLALNLQTHEFDTLLTLLEAAQFWNLPLKDWRTSDLDGSTWTLERVKNGKYHAITRWSPFSPFPKNDDLVEGDLESLSQERVYLEGQITAVFTYLWALSGEANERLPDLSSKNQFLEKYTSPLDGLQILDSVVSKACLVFPIHAEIYASRRMR